MRARVGGAILSIVAKTMTLKAFGQGTRRSRLKSIGVRKHPGGGREYTSAIGESNVLGGIPRDREGSVVRVGYVVIRIGRVYCGRGRRGC